MMPEAMTSRKMQAVKTRKKIFDTAIELFGSKGYENVSIVEICEKAGVSTGAFYHHFKAKDQILIEDFARGNDLYRRMQKEVAGMDDNREILRTFVTAVMRFVEDMGPKHVKVTYHVQIGPGKEPSFLGNEGIVLYPIVTALYREAQAQGEVRDDLRAEDLAGLTIHCYRGIIYDWCEANGSFDLLKTAEQMIDILTDGVFSRR